MRLVAREVVEAFSRAEYKRHIKFTETPTVGVMEAVRLLDQREFIFRGRAYRVPPLPWHLAAEMLDVRERLRSVKPGARLADTIEVFERAARLSKKACRPTGFLRRLFWPITLNPFRQATPWQVGRNLGFFSTCLVLDQHQPQVGEDLPGSGTFNPTSSASSNGIPRGSIPRGGQANGKASRSPGLTT